MTGATNPVSSSGSTKIDKNAHIFAFLDDYVALPYPPNSAVLIDGAWGIGKSFAVGEYIASLKARSKSAVYISLYGLKSADEIDTLLLTNTLTLDNKYAQYGARFAKAAFKKFGLGVDGKFADFLPKDTIDLIIFDDIERAAMPSSEVLGYINTFVEHDGMRVLIICNEAEVSDNDSYRRIREKVVGTTFQLQMNERPALQSFISQVTDLEARSFLSAHSDDVLAIFQQSDTWNLRLLRQTIWAWSRLFPHIEKRFRERSRGMIVALRLFTALSIELKAGRITCDDLQDRATKIVSGRIKGKNGEGESTPLSRAQKRYQNLWLSNSVLNDDVLKQVLCEGRHDSIAINDSLSHSEYFLTADEEPAWQTAWYGIERDPSEYADAFAVMEKEFKNRDFTKEGEILHVFGLRLFGAIIGQIAISESDVVAECKSYIDDLFQSEKLATSSSDDSWLTGAFGLGFVEDKNPNFKALVSYYRDRCKDAFARTWPDELNKLYSLMGSDVDAFFAQVCRTNDERANPFAYAPIFSVSKPTDFVTAMLAAHPSAQRTIFTALEGRYQFGRLKSELADERNWLIGVRDDLLRYASDPKTTAIRRFAIRNDVTRIIDPLLA